MPGKSLNFWNESAGPSWIHEAASMQFHRIVADGLRYSAEGDGRFWPSRLWVCPSEMTSDKSSSHTLQEPTPLLNQCMPPEPRLFIIGELVHLGCLVVAQAVERAQRPVFALFFSHAAHLGRW